MSNENMQGFCAKDNSESDMSKGCRHPNDFCQHRSSCIIHFLEKEKGRKGRKREEVQKGGGTEE